MKTLLEKAIKPSLKLKIKRVIQLLVRFFLVLLFENATAKVTSTITTITIIARSTAKAGDFTREGEVEEGEELAEDEEVGELECDDEGV